MSWWVTGSWLIILAQHTNRSREVRMGILRLTLALMALMALMALALSASAIAAPVVVKVDLQPLIRAAASSKVQFAVPVAHSASASKDGHWLKVGEREEWHYAVQVPTAISLSFHAGKISLPASATLTVKSSVSTVTYRAADVRKSDLWSRVQPGDSLQFTLSVAAGERGTVVFEIQSLQAGYRALGPQATDHPYYRQLLRVSAAASTGSCAQNYECSVSAANTPIAQATVGIVVANLYQCTGTLLNDVPGDNTPYLLTARHCENGVLGGGAPSNASGLTVYWDAVSTCGAALGSIYDPSIATQTGATTVVEQQDAWLVKLDENPVVKDAQFAGFDASGSAVQGGYTIQHALGFDKQLTGWFGQAYSAQQSGVLGVSYISDFLETVNSQGNIGPGSSGSGLINASNRLVGSLSLGRQSNDPSGYEACPISNPTAPNGTNGAAYFTSLAAVWNSTADMSSSTGATTVQSVLDPASSGTNIVSSTPAINLNFAASTYSLQDGQPLVLSWNAANATQCSATGGVSGDGWSGSLRASGSVTVNEMIGGQIHYGLTCQLTANRKVVSNLLVNWYGSTPSVFLDTFGIRWTGAQSTLTWTSNLTPCSLSGGSLALTNLPSSGSVNTTQGTAGDITYLMSCGSGITASASTTVSYITPSLPFRPNGTDRLLGEPLFFYWYSYADTCIPSGGAPNDGWSTNAYKGAGTSGPIVDTLGTWTYTLTCTAGPNTVTQSATVTVENNLPYVTASVTPTAVTFTGTPADYVAISWKSNLTDCSVASNPNMLDGEYSTYPLLPSGASDAEDTGTYSPRQPGTYTVTVTCNSAVGASHGTATSAPITLTVAPPQAPTASISVNPATVTKGQQFTVTWSSTNAQNCVDTGTAQSIGALWGLGSSLTPSGSQLLSTNEPGTGTLGITCQSIDSNQGSVSAQTTITIVEAPAPSATITATSTKVIVGQAFTLTWSSSNASSCTASGGGADGSTWSGTLAVSGSVTQTASTTGTFTYSLVCSSSGQSVQAQQVITVTASSGAGGGTSSGGHSGGGSLTFVELSILASLVPLAARRRSYPARPISS
jgi:hypothetical protein